MANIHIHFIGPWQLFLEVQKIQVDLKDISDARDFINAHYCSVFEKKLQSMGVNKKESVWDNSNVLLNGRKIGLSDKTTFKDGDRLDLIPLIAGG